MKDKQFLSKKNYIGNLKLVRSRSKPKKKRKKKNEEEEWRKVTKQLLLTKYLI